MQKLLFSVEKKKKYDIEPLKLYVEKEYIKNFILHERKH